MIAYLHKDRLKTVQRRHPWIYSRAIRRFEGNPGPGDIVTLASEDGVFLARGLWNPASSIRLRALSWMDEPIDDDFWARRIRGAVSRRGVLHPGAGRRLINAENDFLPGLIVDQYGDWLVMQALSVGIDQRKGMLTEILADVVKPRGIYERGDADGRKREGLDAESGVLWGEEPPELVEIIEDEHRFRVDVRVGHKTGFYLDQRENRRLFADVITPGMRVLNAFAYTGGFAVYAYAAGADSVISIDSSEPSLELAADNLRLNGFGDGPLIAGDVFEVMRDYRDSGELFDAIVLDPPKFAKHPAQVETALRGYKDINLLAWQLLRPGGLLMSFSCSGAVSVELFRKVVFGALADAKRDAQVLRELQAPPDHPVALTFPEGAYLKGLLCRAL